VFIRSAVFRRRPYKKIKPPQVYGVAAAVPVIAQVTVGTWSVPVTFAAGDTLRLTASGAAVDNPKIRVTIALDPI
jgi:hypothetical protein